MLMRSDMAFLLGMPSLHLVIPELVGVTAHSSQQYLLSLLTASSGRPWKGGRSVARGHHPKPGLCLTQPNQSCVLVQHLHTSRHAMSRQTPFTCAAGPFPRSRGHDREGRNAIDPPRCIRVAADRQGQGRPQPPSPPSTGTVDLKAEVCTDCMYYVLYTVHRRYNVNRVHRGGETNLNPIGY